MEIASAVLMNLATASFSLGLNTLADNKDCHYVGRFEIRSNCMILLRCMALEDFYTRVNYRTNISILFY